MHFRAFARLALGAVSLAVAAGAFGQSYGSGDQVLSLGHAAFRGQISSVQYHMNTDGYLYGDGGGATFVASVVLPEGAVITQMCMYANVNDAEKHVSAALNYSRLLAGGQNEPFWGSVGTVDDDVPIGYGYVCSAINYTVHNIGGGYNIAHDLYANVPAPSGLGGIRLTWHRQVSPAPGSPTFGDVQPGDFGYQQIEALVASGVTGGCGGGNYCPNATVTRAQMAIFLAKALGLHWAN